MPIRHTNKGWWWGSKGPFDTKAKALQVARAAHASGFKEANTMNNYSPFLSKLLNSVTITHIMHLQSTSFANHMALGDFYEGLDDLVDSLIESTQGKYGLVEGYAYDASESTQPPLQYLIGLSEYVANARNDMPQDSEIQNIIDEIASLIDSTVYKLRFLK